MTAAHRTFSDIQIGVVLRFAFNGNRFLFNGKYEHPEFETLADVKDWYDGFEVTPSFYHIEQWREHYGVTDSEWQEFERLFGEAYGRQRELLISSVRKEAERREQRRLDEERKAAEEARRKHDVRQELAGGEGLAVIECLGDHYLDLPHANYWEHNIRKPISKALHDLLLVEFGVVDREPGYDPDEDDWDDDEP